MIVGLGARAYRAPITDAADIERHLALRRGRGDELRARCRALLRGMLQSPRFLYRVEIGTSEKVSDRAVKLSPYEVAARLSYMLWGTLPDARLNEAIEDGSLTTKEGRRGAARLDARGRARREAGQSLPRQLDAHERPEQRGEGRGRLPRVAIAVVP